MRDTVTTLDARSLTSNHQDQESLCRRFFKSLLQGSSLGLFGVAFPEVESDFLLRPVAPRFGFFQPEFMVLLVERRAHSAQQFLGAIFRNLFHLLLLCTRFAPVM
jgi:hypothetical protein